MLSRARQSRGFTLVELLVVVGVIAILASLAAPALGSITGANARRAAGELAGGMRYLFDTAALRHARCRMVLDVEGRAWWAECENGSAGAAAASPPAAGGDSSRGSEPGSGGAAKGGEGGEDDAELARRFPGEKNAELRKLLARTAFGAFKDRLVERRELPGATAFGKVRVEGRDDASEGKAYVYFFPGGQAQRAFVPVADGNNLYTIVVEPFTGRSRVVTGAVEVRE